MDSNDFAKFIASIKPGGVFPFTTFLAPAPPEFEMRWFEDEPIKTETELLRENIDREWDW